VTRLRAAKSGVRMPE